MTGWRSSCLNWLIRCESSRPAGSGPTITNGLTVRSEVLPRNRSWPWRPELYFCARLEMGGLPPTWVTDCEFMLLYWGVLPYLMLWFSGGPRNRPSAATGCYAVTPHRTSSYCTYDVSRCLIRAAHFVTLASDTSPSRLPMNSNLSRAALSANLMSQRFSMNFSKRMPRFRISSGPQFA